MSEKRLKVRIYDPANDHDILSGMIITPNGTLDLQIAIPSFKTVILNVAREQTVRDHPGAEVPYWTDLVKEKPFTDTWIYPIAMVVTRQLKLGEQTLERQIHSYTAIDGSKYNVQDDLRRKNPTLLEQEFRQQARHNIHRFQMKFVEFKDADFTIHFVYPDQVDPKW